MSDIKAIVGAGMFPAFLSAAFGAPEHLQFLLFAFGAAWGGLLMKHS